MYMQLTSYNINHNGITENRNIMSKTVMELWQNKWNCNSWYNNRTTKIVTEMEWLKLQHNDGNYNIMAE